MGDKPRRSRCPLRVAPVFLPIKAPGLISTNSANGLLPPIEILVGNGVLQPVVKRAVNTRTHMIRRSTLLPLE